MARNRAITGGGSAAPVRVRDPSAFVNPDPAGHVGRADEGVDIGDAPAGSAVVDPVPGISVLGGIIRDWYAGQPYEWFKVISGPFKGRAWYAAEQIGFSVTQPGQRVSQGQEIGKIAATGTGTEWGWADPATGEALARGHYTEGVPTPEGLDFKRRVLGAKGGTPPGGGGGVLPSVTQGVQDATAVWTQYENELSGGAGGGPAGTPPAGPAAPVRGRNQRWVVTASAEDDPPGAAGSCGAIKANGYSELSTVPMGVASDFAGLGKLPCGTALKITNPATGASVQEVKQDVGAGSSFLPVMGLYPATRAALGLGNEGRYTVVIERVDGGALRPVRGRPTSGSSAVDVGLPLGPLLAPLAGPLAPLLLLTSAGDAIGSTLDFLKWIAWIFHPRSILRVVEFLTGITIMGFGLHAMIQDARGVQGQPLAQRVASDVISFTPAGRAARVAKAGASGRLAGRRAVQHKERSAAYKKGRQRGAASSSNRRAKRESRKIRPEDIPF